MAGGLRVKVPRRGIGGLAYVVDAKKLKIHMSSSPGMVADPATIDPSLTAEQRWAQATEMMKEMNVSMGPGVLE